MYSPPHFREDRTEVLHELIRKHPLATLVTLGADGLTANPIPFTLVTDGGLGILRAHLAKANGQLIDLRAGGEALVIFQGPASYITPSWYASKREHGRVVPTWNYTMVQARGVPHVMDEVAWVRSQVDHLTGTQEDQRSQPWRTTDAPEKFVDGQMKGITGVEIPIQQLQGKWKVSQNRSTADRDSVRSGLLAEQGSESMARLVGDRSHG